MVFKLIATYSTVKVKRPFGLLACNPGNTERNLHKRNLSQVQIGEPHIGFTITPEIPCESEVSLQIPIVEKKLPTIVEELPHHLAIHKISQTFDTVQHLARSLLNTVKVGIRGNRQGVHDFVEVGYNGRLSLAVIYILPLSDESERSVAFVMDGSDLCGTSLDSVVICVVGRPGDSQSHVYFVAVRFRFFVLNVFTFQSLLKISWFKKKYKKF